MLIKFVPHKNQKKNMQKIQANRICKQLKNMTQSSEEFFWKFRTENFFEKKKCWFRILCNWGVIYWLSLMGI